MNILIVLLGLSLFAISDSRRNSFSFRGDNLEAEQDDHDDSITGSYSWTSPDGTHYFLKYIADENGYRVVETNALPVSSTGLRADGNQGSFVHHDDDNSREFRRHDDDVSREFRRRDDDHSREFRRRDDDFSREFRRHDDDFSREFGRHDDDVSREFRSRDDDEFDFDK